MVKILGGSLVLIAAYLFGMKLMEPAAEHIRLLEEGDLLYRILESEIRNTRTPLPILFGKPNRFNGSLSKSGGNANDAPYYDTGNSCRG